MNRVRSILGVALVSVTPVLLMALISARPLTGQARADAAGQSVSEPAAPADGAGTSAGTETDAGANTGTGTGTDAGTDAGTGADMGATAAGPAVNPAEGDESGREAGLWLDKSGRETSPDLETTVTLIGPDGERQLDMRQYLAGVVAAEMPASFLPEALKAQAVAARTFTLFRMTGEQVHEGGAVCSDPGCCKAYMTPEQLRQRWGSDYEKNSERIRQAVEQTDGEIVVYDGRPIFAAFHSSSCGSTEDSENVWSSALPYLRSVDSPERAENVPGYYSELTVSYAELAHIAAESCPGADLGANAEQWLTGAEYTSSGRLRSVYFGGVRLSGTQLRKMLQLRSTSVIWETEEEGVHFYVSGYGHGVGMSQYGAETMAEDGADYTEILAHYYTGTELAGLGAGQLAGYREADG